MKIYYNDVDPVVCSWLRELMQEGVIPEGDIDERSIAEVKAADVLGYERAHFFCGIGGWEYALQLARWPEGEPVWTGSCPCPPFSSAGKKKQCPECAGKPIPHPLKTGIFACVECGHEWLADDRHLWPEFLRLIRECRPPIIFGEQVAGADGVIWVTGVRATVEALDYRFGAADLCAAGIRAPHRRQRLWWMAHTEGGGRQGFPAASEQGWRVNLEPGGRMADTDLHGRDSGVAGNEGGEAGAGCQSGHEPDRRSDDGLADADGDGCGGPEGASSEPCGDGADGGLHPGDTHLVDHAVSTRSQGHAGDGEPPDDGAGAQRSSATAGHADPWGDYRILHFRDGKTRRIESSLEPLVDGLPRGMVHSGDPSAPIEPNQSAEGRQARLKGYGNAIVPHVGARFIRACRQAIGLACLFFALTCYSATGIASWYGEPHRGKLQANGKPFNPDALTCASWDYPLGTRLKVSLGSRSVIVTVTDRGPAKRLNRAIDLSRAAFARLADPDAGLIQVTIEKL